MQKLISILVLGILFFSLVFVSGFEQEPLQKVNVKLEEFDRSFKAYDTLVVEPYLLKIQLDRGTAKIIIRKKTFKIEVKPTNIIVPDATKRGIYVYSGKIKGKEDSFVSIVVSDNVFLVYIQDGKNYYVIDQTNKKYNGKIIHVAYSSKDRKTVKPGLYPDLSKDVVREDVNEAEEITSQKIIIQSLATGQVTVDLFAAYDNEFENHFSDPEAEIAQMINTVNNAFSPAGVQLRIRAYKRYTNIPNGICTTVLNSFKTSARTDRYNSGSDLAFLFSGKDFSDIYNPALGCSDGYSGYYDKGFSTGQMIPDAGSSYQATFWDRTIIVAHELGHNFNAKHDEAYTWVEYEGTGMLMHYYTIMWPEFIGSNSWTNDIQILEFSDRDYHGDATHDNIGRIRSAAPIVASFR